MAASDSLLIAALSVSRNDSVAPFPQAADERTLSAIFGRVSDTLACVAEPGEWQVFELDDISPVQRAYLVERGMMTPSFSRMRGRGRGLAVYQGGRASLEINGQDHLRLLGSRVGGSLAELWSVLDTLDDQLEAAVAYAFDDSWGYLASQPTDAGTGVRAYATVHMPGLMVTGMLASVAMQLISQGLAVAPLWDGAGGFFQISNRSGRGSSELALAETVTAAAHDVADRERSVRKSLSRDHPTRVRDHIGRALGVSQHAWSMGIGEATSLVSSLWVGAATAVVEAPWMTHEAVFSLLRRLQPGHLVVDELGAGHAGLDDPRVDEIRARIMRETFADTRVST